jgi:hypothetical protein
LWKTDRRICCVTMSVSKLTGATKVMTNWRIQTLRSPERIAYRRAKSGPGMKLWMDAWRTSYRLKSFIILDAMFCSQFDTKKKHGLAFWAVATIVQLGFELHGHLYEVAYNTTYN